MRIYLVRHGIAEEPSFNKNDSARELTMEGIQKMHSIGKGFAGLNPEIGLIISSPYIRAKQTAAILAEEISFKSNIGFDKRLVPSAGFDEFSELLSENTQQSGVMFVGHEPSMSSFVSGLCADHALRLEFKKGAICCIEIIHSWAARGELLWYAPPQILIR
ncbi:MAG: phosphohistidine phosphatase SixA [Bacteroidota bacterium]